MHKKQVDTHALTGVALSEVKLRLSGVLLALVPHIASDDGFVDAYRGDEKSFAPDTAAIPVHLLQEVRKALFELQAGYRFQYVYDL